MNLNIELMIHMKEIKQLLQEELRCVSYNVTLNIPIYQLLCELWLSLLLTQ